MKLYTIKPLVWEDAGEKDECVSAGPYFVYVSNDHTHGKQTWWYEILLRHEETDLKDVIVTRARGFDTKTSAKLAAESAYVKLLEEALEEHK